MYEHLRITATKAKTTVIGHITLEGSQINIIKRGPDLYVHAGDIDDAKFNIREVNWLVKRAVDRVTTRADGIASWQAGMLKVKAVVVDGKITKFDT